MSQPPPVPFHCFRLSTASRDVIAVRRPALAEAGARAVFVAGPAADLVLRLCGAGAMTLGRHVLVRRWLVLGHGTGPALPGWLAAHELAHVQQFARAGTLTFLARYVFDYARGLRGLSAAARHAAYRAIPVERDAMAAEQGFESGTPLTLDPV